MTNTIIIDENLLEQQVENSINRSVRHCRIGKVTRKLLPQGGGAIIPQGWTPWYPFAGPTRAGMGRP